MLIKNKQSGMTLLELMLALSLGIIVVAALMKMFDGSHVNYRAISALNELEENAAFANVFVTDELKKAGYRPLSETIKGRSWEKGVRDLVSKNTGSFVGSADLVAVTGLSGLQFPIVTDVVGNTEGSPGDEFVRAYFLGDEENDLRNCAGTHVPHGSIGYSEFRTRVNKLGGVDLICNGGLWNADDGLNEVLVTVLYNAVDGFQVRYMVDVNEGFPNCGSSTNTMNVVLNGEQVNNFRSCSRTIGNRLLNKINNVVVEIDLASSKSNIIGQGQSQPDRSADANAGGKLVKQTMFSVHMENSLL